MEESDSAHFVPKGKIDGSFPDEKEILGKSGHSRMDLNIQRKLRGFIIAPESHPQVGDGGTEDAKKMRVCERGVVVSALGQALSPSSGWSTLVPRKLRKVMPVLN